MVICYAERNDSGGMEIYLFIDCMPIWAVDDVLFSIWARQVALSVCNLCCCGDSPSADH